MINTKKSKCSGVLLYGASRVYNGPMLNLALQQRYSQNAECRISVLLCLLSQKRSAWIGIWGGRGWSRVGSGSRSGSGRVRGCLFWDLGLLGLWVFCGEIALCQPGSRLVGVGESGKSHETRESLVLFGEFCCYLGSATAGCVNRGTEYANGEGNINKESTREKRRSCLFSSLMS